MKISESFPPVPGVTLTHWLQPRGHLGITKKQITFLLNLKHWAQPRATRSGIRYKECPEYQDVLHSIKLEHMICYFDILYFKKQHMSSCYQIILSRSCIISFPSNKSTFTTLPWPLKRLQRRGGKKTWAVELGLGRQVRNNFLSDEIFWRDQSFPLVNRDLINIFTIAEKIRYMDAVPHVWTPLLT